MSFFVDRGSSQSGVLVYSHKLCVFTCLSSKLWGSTMEGMEFFSFNHLCYLFPLVISKD